MKNGKRKTGVQCLKCKACGKCFQESYKNNGSKPETKWNKRYSKSFRNKSKYSNISFKKTEKKLTNINPKYVNTKEPIKIRLELVKIILRRLSVNILLFVLASNDV